jgi:hypothetical protein
MHYPNGYFSFLLCLWLGLAIYIKDICKKFLRGNVLYNLAETFWGRERGGSQTCIENSILYDDTDIFIGFYTPHIL